MYILFNKEDIARVDKLNFHLESIGKALWANVVIQLCDDSVKISLERKKEMIDIVRAYTDKRYRNISTKE